jgi:hypothetical protein
MFATVDGAKTLSGSVDQRSRLGTVDDLWQQGASKKKRGAASSKAKTVAA